MQNEINDALQALKDMDETALDDVLHLARQRRNLWYFYDLPLPFRIAIVQVPVGLMMFFAFPAPPNLPKIAVPIIWVASYCLALILTSMSSHARYKRAYHIHWVKA